MNNQELLAVAVYKEIEKNVEGIPNFFYQTTETQNEGLVFRISDSSYIKKYFGDTETYAYEMALIKPRSNHYAQIQLLQNIIYEIIKIKKIFINNIMYSVGLIYINNKPIPLDNWEQFQLSGLDEVSQTYTINLGFVIRKETECQK